MHALRVASLCVEEDQFSIQTYCRMRLAHTHIDTHSILCSISKKRQNKNHYLLSHHIKGSLMFEICVQMMSHHCRWRTRTPPKHTISMTIYRYHLIRPECLHIFMVQSIKNLTYFFLFWPVSPSALLLLVVMGCHFGFCSPWTHSHTWWTCVHFDMVLNICWRWLVLRTFRMPELKWNIDIMI